MAHPTLADVEQAIHSVLSPLGFKKRKLSWSRECPEVTQYFRLEKQTWGQPKYNISYGARIHKLGDRGNMEWIPEQQLPKELLMPVIHAFTMNYNVSLDERLRIIHQFLNEYVVSAFSASATLENIRAIFTASPSGRLRRALLGFKPQELLSD